MEIETKIKCDYCKDRRWVWWVDMRIGFNTKYFKPCFECNENGFIFHDSLIQEVDDYKEKKELEMISNSLKYDDREWEEIQKGMDNIRNIE